MKLSSWIRQDGLLHILVSALLVVAISVVLPVWLSLLIALAIGIGKELYDRTHKGACTWHDVICDVIGLAIGTILIVLI